MKWDLDSHTSSRSLTHPAGNLNNKPAARNDHTAQPETEPALNRFALKPLALGGYRAAFSIILMGNQIADYERCRSRVDSARACAPIVRLCAPNRWTGHPHRGMCECS